MRIEHIGDATLYLGDCLEIPCRRIADAYKQPRLFDDPKPSAAVAQDLGL